MSTDYKEHTYRPEMFKDTNERTSYSKMHTWMTLKPKEKMYRPPQVSIPPPPPDDKNSSQNLQPKTKIASLSHQKKVRNAIVPKLEDFYQDRDYYLPTKKVNSYSNVPMMHFDYDIMSDIGTTGKAKKPRYLPKLVYKSFEDEIPKSEVPLFAGAMPPVHMQYYKSGGYDDFHKAALKQSRDEMYSQVHPILPTSVRNGQCGSGWRHVKEVQQAKSEKQVYIDGQICVNDKADKSNSQHSSRRISEPVHIPSPARSQRSNSGLPHDPNFKPRLIQLNQEEKIEKLEFEDRDAQKGIEYNNWHLLR